MIPVRREVLRFHVGKRLPFAVDAGTGVEHGIPPHAAVEGVDRLHPLAAAFVVAGVEQIPLPGSGRAQLVEHDAAFRVVRPLPEDAA